MKSGKKSSLVASEIAALWNTYESDSLAICMFKHFLNNVDDRKTRNLIEKAKQLSESHIEDIKKIYDEENLTVPIGFGKDDLDEKAPRIFTDVFYLFYLSDMAGFGIDGYSLFNRYIVRPDIRDFFIACIKDACDLYREVADLMCEYGVFSKSPRVEVDKSSTFVESDSFVSGLNVNPRPLVVREVTSIFSGLVFDAMWRAISIGFGQSCRSKQVKNYFFKGRDIATDHYKKFSEYLMNEHLNISSNSDTFVTDSTIPAFSDRLMMHHILVLCNFAITVDGFSIAASLRPDLTMMHTKFAAEIAKYASKGIKLMIKNKWMEQPPQIIRHDKLS